MHLSTACILFFSALPLCYCGETIWAVNAGGDVHVDSNGVRYQADKNPDGTPSDYGKGLIVGRVPGADQLLYQTERYHTEDFEYKFSTPKNGDYVLVLKFCEVWFSAPDQKVFDVVLNGLTVVSDLDIFSKVGRGAAHDEHVAFKIKDKKLTVAGDTAAAGNSITIKFVKGHRDNPKINALYVMRGSLSDVPQLPPVRHESPDDILIDEEEEETADDEEETPRSTNRKEPAERKAHVSGQKVADPYAVGQETSSLLIPMAVALLAVIPLVYCLCKV